jgi:hypothetical protein
MILILMLRPSLWPARIPWSEATGELLRCLEFANGK